MVVQGAGKVGGGVAKLAAAEGAVVSIADVSARRVAEIAAATGATSIGVDDALTTECEILSPCAMGGVLSDETVPLLRCRMVCGAANNMLEDDAAGALLVACGIDYVPDFIANAGGIIAIAEERNGFDHDRAMALADSIGDVVREVCAESQATGVSALVVARQRAANRLQGATT